MDCQVKGELSKDVNVSLRLRDGSRRWSNNGHVQLTPILLSFLTPALMVLKILSLYLLRLSLSPRLLVCFLKFNLLFLVLIRA